MGKPLDTAHEYTAVEVAGVMQQLDLASRTWAEFAACIEETPDKMLAAHNHRTLERALANLQSVAGAINKSIYAYRAGKPIPPGSLKPRSPGRTAKTARVQVAEPAKKYVKPKGPKRG